MSLALGPGLPSCVNPLEVMQSLTLFCQTLSYSSTLPFGDFKQSAIARFFCFLSELKSQPINAICQPSK